jgi:type IV pilus assembly protein PilY1
MRFFLPILFLASCFGALIVGTPVSAQAPDIRNIRPHVMLLVDTSGSMERKPDCICSTPACLECIPVCSAGTYEQNRWSIVAQALTGEFTPYECNAETRLGGIYSGQYDEGYFLPHIQLPQELVAYAGSQSGNGVLDTYLERIKFGLMTFDAIATLSDQPPLVPQSTFQSAAFLTDSAGTPGMYSFGDDKPYSFPGAVTTYMINNGARSAVAPEGGLVGVGADSTASMTSTNASIQATILGDSGLGKNPLRPFGATPTAALVEDLQVFLQTDGDITRKTSGTGPGDPFYACRPRSAVLITDGFPNADMRGEPVNCEDLGQPVGANGCPYREVSETVADMVAAGELDQFYVIGFALDGDPAQVATVEALLDDIASVGATDQAYLVADRAELVSALSLILNEQNPGATSRTAPVITGLSPGLVQAEFISGFNVSSEASDPWDGILERRRIECENGIPVTQTVEDRDRFQLVLNNQTTPPSDVQPFSSGTSATFSGGFSRNLWTIVPTDPANINGYLIGDGKNKLTSLSEDGIDVPADTGLEVRDVTPGEFSKALSPEYLFGIGSTDSAGRDALVDWIHGVPGTDREFERLGDIYHSTPAIVGPLVDDLEDRSYNDWRLGLAHQQSPDPLEDLSADGWQLSERPRVIYASTNDGIIHAFLADDYGSGAFTAGNGLDEFSCANNKAAGTELWGFIPPMFLDDLDDLLVGGSKQWFADGNIVVRNLYDVRSFSQSDGSGGVEDSPAGQTNVWRTVMLLSFRNGGQGMIALDVTNPCKPEFLWQFTDPNLGDTYGQPTAAQIFVEDSDPTPLGNAGGPVVFKPRQSRGVVLLPGGQGVQDAGSCSYTVAGPALPQGMTTATNSTITPRNTRRCWRGTTSSPAEARHGRSLHFIDLITGTVIREIGETRFPAPLNGGVSVFRGDTGTVASVAYTVDADGILWRVDMSSADPEDWDAEALHDLYYDEGFDDAEPTYYPPTLSINGAGDIVVLVGTGNIDVLDDATAVNQVVSITEKLSFGTDGFIDSLDGRLNWEVELLDGEQMTGPLELFGGQVFFGTFKSGTGTAIDACPLGTSRIFGVSYLDDPANVGNPIPLLEDSGGTAVPFLDSTSIPELSNSLLVGLQVAQQPVCTLTESISITDPFTGVASTLAMPYATSGRAFKLMAHLSGSSALSSGLSIAVLEENIGAPEGFTVVSAMAETLE